MRNGMIPSRSYAGIHVCSHYEAHTSSESRQDPYSVATIYSYLYHKEHEVNRLIIALECVRYRISADEAMQHIAKT